MIKEFKNLIFKRKISEMNKITLKKIFYLLNFVLEISEEIPKDNKILEKKIEEYLNSHIFSEKIKDIDKNETKKSIIDIRIRSIMQTESLEEYTTKLVKENYAIYEYANKTIIYIKNDKITKEELILEIKNYNYNDVLLIGETKKKIIKFQNLFKKNINIKDYTKIILKNTTL